MKTVFVDIDTQLDFLFPAGALAVPGADVLAGPLRELTRTAASTKSQIISTMDAHSENDPEFQSWPPHCITGTFGQAKAAATLLPNAMRVPNQMLEPGILMSHANAPQLIFEKQDVDCFTNPSLRPMLNIFGGERFIVYGVAAEVCVTRALFGLLQREGRVELVTDATKEIDEAQWRNTLAHFQASGGYLTTTGAVLALLSHT